MDGDSIRLLLIFCVLVLFSAYFSCTESCMMLMNKIRIKQQAEDGNKRAKHALYISNHFEKALSTLLIGNNIVNAATASVATLLVLRLFEGHDPDMVNLIGTLCTTGIVFLFGEMIPKTLAGDRTDTLSLVLVPSLRPLMKLLTPLSALFTGVSSLMTRCFKADDLPTITEDELIDIIDTAEEEGVVDEEQSDLLKSAMEFSGTTASNVMTPLDQIVAIDISETPAEIMAKFRECQHSRFPVYDTNMDHMIGYLPMRVFLREYFKNPNVSVRELLVPPFCVRSDAKIDDLLTIMRQHKFYMAIVKEEQKTVGIVTIEDFLEELVGDIWDESDEIDQTFTKLGGNRYRVDTHMTLGEALSRLNCPPPDARLEKTPLIAWIFEMFRHIPELGESFRYRNMEITVDQIDGHRVSFIEIYIDNDFVPDDQAESDEDPVVGASETTDATDTAFDEAAEEVTTV